jgi:hypothetical protein
MKKTIFLCIAAIIFMLSAVSCNKMCQCTRTYENPNIPTDIYDVNLAEAGLNKCSDLNVITEDANGRTIIECVKKTN